MKISYPPLYEISMRLGFLFLIFKFGGAFKLHSHFQLPKKEVNNINHSDSLILEVNTNHKGILIIQSLFIIILLHFT